MPGPETFDLDLYLVVQQDTGRAPEEPDPQASYGTFSVLWQIEQARSLQLPYLYLGYWIEQSPKMAYKTQYRPFELLLEGLWRPPLRSSDSSQRR